MIANSREIAMLTLYDIEYKKTYSNMALKNYLSKNKHLSREDKGLVTALVYGVVSKKITLDYILSVYSKVKLKKISKYILQILRLGIYQLVFMDKIPESAAVNESVKLAKRYGHGASAGFVNGVLHSVIRGRKKLAYPKDSLEFLSVKYSYPTDLISRWIEQFGLEFTESFMKASNSEPVMTLRANTLKTTAEELVSSLANDGISSKISPYYSMAVETKGFDVVTSKLYHDGMFTPQDSAAMMASAILSPNADSTVLDLCSAPGGKTTHLAQLMNNKGKIIAFDIHEHKIKLIEDNAKRLGITIIQGVCKDSTVHTSQYDEMADYVLADVPCSGLGIIRKKPDIKWNEPIDFQLFDIQMNILENASRYLKSGGELVYSTCTINPHENEDVIEAFLSRHADFYPMDIDEYLPDVLKKESAKKGYITFYPNVDGIDGFFICKLKKR